MLTKNRLQEPVLSMNKLLVYPSPGKDLNRCTMNCCCNCYH